MGQINSPPDVLYHYYRFDDFAEEVVSRRQIYLSSPLTYNDPFDSQVRPFDSHPVSATELKTYLNKLKAKHGLTSRQIQQMIAHPEATSVLRKLGHSFVTQIGIYCLSEKKDSLLMWAHYANNHTGFCVGFKTDNPFFGRAQQIIYAADYPQFNFFKAPQKKITQSMLLTKAADWHYEKEWRLIDSERGVGPQFYPAAAVAEVVFGCRIKDEDKKKMMTWLSAASNIRIIRAKLGVNKFALDFDL